MACCGVALNRFVMTVQTLALPTLSFDQFLSYFPSWQETGTFLAVVAYGVLVYSFSFRYFQLFPEERELKLEVRQQEKSPNWLGGIDMFPWNYGFHWNPAHVIFLGAFYTVLVVVATTLVCGALRVAPRPAAQARREEHPLAFRLPRSAGARPRLPARADRRIPDAANARTPSIAANARRTPS